VKTERLRQKEHLLEEENGTRKRRATDLLVQLDCHWRCPRQAEIDDQEAKTWKIEMVLWLRFRLPFAIVIQPFCLASCSPIVVLNALHQRPVVVTIESILQNLQCNLKLNARLCLGSHNQPKLHHRGPPPACLALGYQLARPFDTRNSHWSLHPCRPCDSHVCRVESTRKWRSIREAEQQKKGRRLL
jgi:hypothetical protein